MKFEKIICVFMSVLMLAAIAVPSVSAEAPQKSHNYDNYIHYRAPLAGTYQKLTADKKLKVVYFGGSVTAGYGSTNAGLYSWQALSSKRLKDNFPSADISVVNTAIGESGTYFGTYRLKQDVIDQKPDLLFIEYAINDKYKHSTKEQAALQYETIVREVRTALPDCDIVTLFVIDKETSDLLPDLYPTAAGHEMIAEAYNIPTVNVGASLVDSMSDKGKEWSTYFIDVVHPTDAGYEKYYDCLEEFLYNSLICEELSSADPVHAMPEIQSDRLLDGNRESLIGAKMQPNVIAVSGFEYNESLYYGPAATPHYGYYECTEGTENASITFKFTGTEFSIWTNFYNTSEVNISVDGGTEKRIVCDRHAPSTLVSKIAPGEHTITVKPAAFGEETAEEQADGTKLKKMKIGALFFRDETKQSCKSGTATEPLITISPVNVGDKYVNVNCGATGSKDWFVVTKKGGTYSERLGKSGKDWNYCIADGTVNHELNTPIAAGEYEVILLLNGGYTEGGRFAFTVSETAGEPIIDKTTYFSAEKITVDWSALPSTVSWAAVYPKGYNSKYEFCDYIYRGAESFPSGENGRYNGYSWPLDSGEYTAVFYEGNGYAVNRKIDFSVISSDITVTPNEVYVGQSDAVSISISSGLAPGAQHRVRLYKANSGMTVNNTGFGNHGINFQDSSKFIGDATFVTTNENGGCTFSVDLHKTLTEPGVYVYAVMDSTWDTKAVIFIEVKDAAKVLLSRNSVPLGANIPLAIKITAGEKGLESNKKYAVRIYKAYGGTTGFGSGGVNFKALICDGAGITTDENGAASVLQTAHIKKITETGEYAYCIMDMANNWNTVARTFFTVTSASDPIPENVPYIKLDKTSVKLGADDKLTLSVGNAAELGITGGWYNVRLYSVKSGFDISDSGFGNSGLNFTPCLGDGVGITLDENGSGTAEQSVHLKGISEPGIYAYAVMDGWNTVARVFFEVSAATGDVNTDGKVDILDLIHLKKMYAGIIEKNNAGDINGDGDVNSLDLAELKKIILSDNA